jgi:hypothetical protein
VVGPAAMGVDAEVEMADVSPEENAELEMGVWGSVGKTRGSWILPTIHF